MWISDRNSSDRLIPTEMQMRSKDMRDENAENKRWGRQRKRSGAVASVFSHVFHHLIDWRCIFSLNLSTWRVITQESWCVMGIKTVIGWFPWSLCHVRLSAMTAGRHFTWDVRNLYTCALMGLAEWPRDEYQQRNPWFHQEGKLQNEQTEGTAVLT